MTHRLPTDMLEATRLTREGRLAEAMALIQGRSAKAATETPSPARTETATRASSSTSASAGFIDLTPPSPGNGDSWTAPQVPEDRASEDRASESGASEGGSDRPESDDMMAGLHIPAFLRSLAGKWTRASKTPADRAAPLPTGETPATEKPTDAKSVGEGQFVERVFSNAAGQRQYKLFIPAAYDGQSLPLVVMLHGCTQSPDDFAAGTRMNELAATGRFFVAYPAQDQRANSAKCWNWFNAGDQRRDQGEPSLIAGMTREIMAAFNIDAGRVYVAGLSAGGAAAAVLGMTYPDLYAAIGIHSGLACGAAKDTMSAFAAMRQGSSGPKASLGDTARQPVPVIVFHGDADSTVNPINGDEIIAQFSGPAPLVSHVTQGQSSNGTGFTRTCKATPDGGILLEQWVLHGLGHAWSGGSKAGSYTDPTGPDASREMIRFFLQQARSSS